MFERWINFDIFDNNPFIVYNMLQIHKHKQDLESCLTSGRIYSVKMWILT